MLLAARYKAMKELKKQLPYIEDGVLLSKLVAYSSKLVIVVYFIMWNSLNLINDLAYKS